MRRPHLFTSEEPWTHWGIQLQALCGREVPEAHWLAVVDAYGDSWITTRNLCADCMAKAEKIRRYQYVIREGQAALDEAQQIA